MKLLLSLAPPPRGLCWVSRPPAPQLPHPWGRPCPAAPAPRPVQSPTSRPRPPSWGPGRLRRRAVLPLGPLGPSSVGGAAGDQRLSGSLRGPHFAPEGISVKSLLSGKDGTPAPRRSPARPLKPRGSPDRCGRGGSAPPPGILQVEPPGWLGRVGLPDLPRVARLGLSPLLSASRFGLSAFLSPGC